MANRPKAYGLSGEISQKIAGKYTKEDELQVVAWICDMTGEKDLDLGTHEDSPQPKVVQEWLKDGKIFYKIMQRLKPNLMKPAHNCVSKMEVMRKTKEMESISFFLKACEEYGMTRTDLFQTVDLYEGRNMGQVLASLFTLSGKSIKHNFDGPTIGVKSADVNKRHHSEQKLNEGKSIIGLQMGTAGGASQKGMTAYGASRQLTS